jgi:hypothetical protein
VDALRRLIGQADEQVSELSLWIDVFELRAGDQRETQLDLDDAGCQRCQISGDPQPPAVLCDRDIEPLVCPVGIGDATPEFDGGRCKTHDAWRLANGAPRIDSALAIFDCDSQHRSSRPFAR